ncbi:MAG: ribosome maturation factor RimM [Desulfuromonadaceae bacterium]|nr:ribosome maturation factor RimM [Desulfuromonadaceae bacterium]
MNNPHELISLGKISATHGIRGHLKLYSYSGNIESLQCSETVFLKGKSGLLKEVGLKTVAAHAGGFILALDGFTDIEEVQPFVGNELCLKRSQLPEPAEDEYYWRDLIGLTVVTDKGVVLGPIADIFETGSSDIYVVRGNNKEYLIPAIADVISVIDIPGRRMIITPLDGLLEL